MAVDVPARTRPALALRGWPGHGRRDRAGAHLRAGTGDGAARLQRPHVLSWCGFHAARNAQPGHVRAALRLDVAGQLAGLLRDLVQRDAGDLHQREVPVAAVGTTIWIARGGPG